MADNFQVPPGIVCITTYGQITGETVQSILAVQQWNLANGLSAVQYPVVSSVLVEKARNDAARQLLQSGAGWILYVDADMTMEANIVGRLVQTAYAEAPHFDVVGGLCYLRGGIHVSTTDFGSGLWESCFPNSGIQEVMRTGGACLLVKRHVFERIPEPWFALRIPKRPIDALHEIDNFARIKFDGKNPLRGGPQQFWEKLEQCALDDPSLHSFTPTEVGEDSGFCDRVKRAGMRIAVDTRIALGHVDRQVIDWTSHRDALRKQEQQHLLWCGIESL